MYIAVDFDGTCVDHRFPDIGKDVPGAEKWLKEITENGGELILWTMRSEGQTDGNVLHDAIEWFKKRSIPLFGINENPGQVWSNSKKAYAHVYIDDSAFGCPLKENPRMGGRPYVDWDIVGPEVVRKLKANS